MTKYSIIVFLFVGYSNPTFAGKVCKQFEDSLTEVECIEDENLLELIRENLTGNTEYPDLNEINLAYTMNAVRSESGASPGDALIIHGNYEFLVRELAGPASSVSKARMVNQAYGYRLARPLPPLATPPRLVGSTDAYDEFVDGIYHSAANNVGYQTDYILWGPPDGGPSTFGCHGCEVRDNCKACCMATRTAM